MEQHAIKSEMSYFDQFNADNKIHVTSDYNLFKILDGNRNVNQLHVKQIKNSVNEHGLLFNIIVINENYEIIDGQHRFHAFQDLKQPIFYVMIMDYGLHEVQVLNSLSKNWKLKDYLESYIKIENEFQLGYKELKWFHDKYHWGMTDSIATIMYNSGAANGSTQTDKFKKGKFESNHLSDAIKYADMLKDFNLPFSTKSSFLRASIKMFKTKSYVHNHFLKKLEYKAAILLDGASVSDYLDLLAKIYNIRCDKSDKIKIGMD